MDIHLIQGDIGAGLKINDGSLDPSKEDKIEVNTGFGLKIGVNDVLEVERANSSKEGIMKVIDNLTSTSTVDALSVNQGKVIKDRTDCMAGGDIKGYIEDATAHAVGEVWLSRNSIGEFKCLVANSDNYPDLTPANPKWLQIDDKKQAEVLSGIGSHYGNFAGDLVLINGNFDLSYKGYTETAIEFSVPAAGLYYMSTTMRISANSVVNAVVEITKNGAVVNSMLFNPPYLQAGVHESVVTISGVVHLIPTDKVLITRSHGDPNKPQRTLTLVKIN